MTADQRAQRTRASRPVRRRASTRLPRMEAGFGLFEGWTSVSPGHLVGRGTGARLGSFRQPSEEGCDRLAAVDDLDRAADR